MSDENGPRHRAQPEPNRLDPLLSILAVITKSGFTVLSIAVLALTTISVVYAGITGTASVVGIALTTVALALLGGIAVVLINRRNKP